MWSAFGTLYKALWNLFGYLIIDNAHIKWKLYLQIHFETYLNKDISKSALQILLLTSGNQFNSSVQAFFVDYLQSLKSNTNQLFGNLKLKTR